MSTLKVNTLTDTAATKSVPIEDVVNGTARAWVNFNGTGTPAIRASYNVSGITDNGTGNYTINFTTALSDTNYATTGATVGANGSNTAGFNIYSDASSQLTTSVQVTLINSSNAAVDREYVSVSVFR